MRDTTRRAALSAATILTVLPASAQGTTPSAVVDAFHAALLQTMREARQLGPHGRERRLRPAMQTAFDLPAMTRIAVGPPWRALAEADQQDLVSAFSDWVVATYANRFDGYGGEIFKDGGENTLQNGDRLVRTQLVRTDDAPVQLNYLLRSGEGRWRVVDVYLDGAISELASRRSDFAALLREGGAPKLAAELRRRTATLLGG